MNPNDHPLRHCASQSVHLYSPVSEQRQPQPMTVGGGGGHHVGSLREQANAHTCTATRRGTKRWSRAETGPTRLCQQVVGDKEMCGQPGAVPAGSTCDMPIMNACSINGTMHKPDPGRAWLRHASSCGHVL